MRFKDRVSAGAQLAQILDAVDPLQAVVLGIPTGGCVIAAQIAAAHKLPLFAVIARKVRSPQFPELALGAVAPDGHIVTDDSISIYRSHLHPDFQRYVARAETEVRERLVIYAEHIPRAEDVAQKHAIIADDGVATGLTVMAAVQYVLRLGAAAVTVAAPVISATAAEYLRSHARTVALALPVDFVAVSQYYEHFPQLSDAEALKYLSRTA